MSLSANNLLIKQLTEFGLSEKEAKVYLALLELEVATVNETAKSANINRSSTYVVIESLKKKGLVSTSEDKKIQRYIAVSPEMLLREAEDKAKKTEDIKNKISNIIPELKALHKDTKHKPRVVVYEGKQGLINAFENTLNNKEKMMRVSSSPGNLEKIISDYLIQYVNKRINLGIKMHGIHPNDKIHRGYIINSPRNFDTYILVPKKKYQFPTDLAIWDDKIGFMSDQNGGISITIQNDIIAEAMKNIFDLAWERAKFIGEEAKGYRTKKKNG
ncbi:MAG: hypothetical protein HY005_00620 [Candidatus Staskawiczbacteria bacterium]|nr:hypothetical protein [Candidatus Staskawiczbacteria bacterium]